MSVKNAWIGRIARPTAERRLERYASVDRRSRSDRQRIGIVEKPVTAEFRTQDMVPVTPARWERLALLRVDVVSSGAHPAALDEAVARTLEALRLNLGFEGIRYLKCGLSGLLAVYSDPAQALYAVRALGRRRAATGSLVRYCLFWGDVLVGPEGGAPVGGEAELLGAILQTSDCDRTSVPCEHRHPDRDRVVLPYGSVAQLPDEMRAQFVPLGSLRVPGLAGALELWTESLSSFLGREPSDSERLFGVAGLHKDTILDLWWERRCRKTIRLAR
jgi:hypothetical protein